MAFVVVIPTINGQIEAGIAVGVDPSLAEVDRLPILRTGNVASTHEAIKINAVKWAAKRNINERAKRLLVNGVAGILDCGLIREVGGVPDGDWILQAREESADGLVPATINAMISSEEMKRAVSIAIATKANFWVMNHHTGQGAVQGYVKKMLDVQYNNNVDEALVSVVHSLGHFISTRHVLSLAQVGGIIATNQVTAADGVEIKFSDDAVMRFASLPAGTHRSGVAYEAAKRLVRSGYAGICPGLADFSALPALRASVLPAVHSQYTKLHAPRCNPG